jgi:hypothetical protein
MDRELPSSSRLSSPRQWRKFGGGAHAADDV